MFSKPEALAPIAATSTYLILARCVAPQNARSLGLSGLIPTAIMISFLEVVWVWCRRAEGQWPVAAGHSGGGFPGAFTQRVQALETPHGFGEGLDRAALVFLHVPVGPQTPREAPHPLVQEVG